VIEWVPTISVDVDTLAIPPLNVCGDPIAVVPSMKVTVPVGAPTPGVTTVTVAVNVTEAPGAEGSADDTTDVEVCAWFTT
jgi:hypothetical protein